MTYEVSGSVVLVTPEQNPTDKFRYRELILCVDGQFPQEICIQFSQHRADLLTGITPKAEVTVSFELQGRRATNQERWFNTIAGFNIKKN